jgi:glycosyltransferase involved in cell wall biosynthesis
VKTNLGVSVVVPVFNSENTLRALVDKLTKTLDNMTEVYEILLIDDYSRDGSWKIICDLSNSNPRIKGYHLRKNLGEEAAVLFGISLTSYDIIVTLDDDLQHDPKWIPALVDKLSEGYDLVYGACPNYYHNKLRNIVTFFVKQILSVFLNWPLIKNISSYRVFKGSLRSGLTGQLNLFATVDVAISNLTSNTGFLNIEINKREVGRSNYNFKKLASFTLNVILGKSLFPLRLIAISGAITFIFGILNFLYVLLDHITNIPKETRSQFTFITVSLFGGLILICVWLLGEILVRYNNSKSLKLSDYLEDTSNLS